MRKLFVSYQFNVGAANSSNFGYAVLTDIDFKILGLEEIKSIADRIANWICESYPTLAREDVRVCILNWRECETE